MCNIPFEINDKWFNKFHTENLSQEFIDWWVEFYGVPDDYHGDSHEYYIRMAFALMGWIANPNRSDTAKKLLN